MITMKGFSDKVLVLLPTIESTKYWGTWTCAELVRVVEHLARFLRNHYAMDTCIFDCLSNGFQFPNFGSEIKRVSCVCPQDRTFFRQAGVVIPPSEYEYPEAFTEAIKHCSLKRGQSTDDRDADASKRIELACRYIIEKEFKVIFDFEFIRPFLRYKSKADDGKIVYTVASNYYITKAQMSGQAYSPGVLLDYDKFNTCLEGWT